MGGLGWCWYTIQYSLSTKLKASPTLEANSSKTLYNLVLNCKENMDQVHKS